MAQKISQLTAAGTLTRAEQIEVSQLSTTVVKTATTISALASDNSFNDSGAGFVAAGFQVGDQVNVAGFTGNVANNLFSAKVTALTTGKMTIGGTDGNAIVDDAAGESVTITKWGSRRTSLDDVVDGLGDMHGPVSSVAGNLGAFSDTGGKDLEDSGVAPSTDGTMAGNSDAKLPTEAAVVTYVADQISDAVADLGDASGPGASVAGNFPAFADTTGKLLGDSGKAPSTDGTMSANSPDLLPVQSAVVTFVANAITAAINALVDASPGALDTLNELAAALGDDANFATTVTNALALKAPLASPGLTGTPTAPTGTPGAGGTQVATQAYADLAAAIAAAAGGPTGNYLISGGGVAYTTGLSVVVSAANYVIQGANNTSAETTLTAGTADPTNPRIDVVALDSSGAAVLIAGTPSATPVKPDVDPATQLERTFILVAAAATTLPTTVTDVYRENSEYTSSQSGANFSFTSAVSPRAGSVSIEATTLAAGNYAQFAVPSSGTIDLATRDSLVLYIKSKAAWNNNRSLLLGWYATGVLKGSQVTLKNGTFGFDSSNTATYQQIVIPLSLFAANGIAVNQFRIIGGGSGGSAIGFYMDDISLQGGLSANGNEMRWRGDWQSGALYKANDVVVSAELTYVALQANNGQTPGASLLYWRSIGGGGGLSRGQMLDMFNIPTFF